MTSNGFSPGVNSSFTTILGIQYNLTTLTHWNYTFYPTNQTLSNGSKCWLVFEPYTPVLLQNGTFLNSSSCYSAILPMGTRSEIGLAFVVLFVLSIIFTFANLRKHGRLFLPTEKRFLPIGRRWQYYWMLFVAAMAIISGVANVDVERYYVTEFPIVLSNFAWFLMLPGTMAIVWESVRHWGSWQERQAVDPNPFILSQEDTRSQVEFFLPLAFYLFFWLNFFMVFPRSWTPIELQRSPSQIILKAEPSATDTRFKAAAFLLFCSWLVAFFSLCHSIFHYNPRTLPIKQPLLLFFSLIMIGYEATIAFDFSISPLNQHGNVAIIYGLGWTPIFLILVIMEVWGYLEPNEDRVLIRQRRIRGAEIDQELGLIKKPHWWRRLHNDHNLNVHDQIARNVNEIGGGAATTKNSSRAIEMGDLPVSNSTHKSSKRPSPDELMKIGAGLIFPTSNPPHRGSERISILDDIQGLPQNSEKKDGASARGRLVGVGGMARFMDIPQEGRPPGYSRGDSSSGTETSSLTLGNGAPSHKIRSMLDV